MPIQIRGKDDSRVLVVDDECAVREILSEGLEAQGFRTEMASSAAEALSTLDRGAFDLVLSDIDMPGGSASSCSSRSSRATRTST